MLHLHLKDDEPIPHLADAIAKQKAKGGRIILYGRTWSALVVSMTQYRVAHVPFDESRITPSLKHSLFSLICGLWSVSGLFAVPMLLILNFRGGMDVTARYSTVSIDPMGYLPPKPGQAERDLKVSQWIFVGLATVGLIALIAYFTLSGIMK